MKRLMGSMALIVAFVLGSALVPSSGPANAAGPAMAPFEDGTVLAGFRAGVGDAAAAAIERQEGASRVKVVGVGTHVLQVGPGRVAEKIAALQRHREVAYAEPDYIVRADTTPNDPQYNKQWGYQKIAAEPAWSTTTGTKSVVVGVVDTGIDYTHPDLAANVWSNPGKVGNCPAGTHGYNALTATCDPMDDNNHGTHVSGTIGAVGNNGVGVTGVNWNVSLMGLKFIGASGYGSTSGAISAIDFAIKAKKAGVNVRVLSNSWGGGGYSTSLLNEINLANANDILFVAAAGNYGSNNDTSPFYPAGYNTPNLLAVAATDQNDSLAGFSNYGAATVHLGAPGVSILSTIRNGGYDYYSGTSMATPHVSGAAALILSASALNTADLKARILGSVDPDPALLGKTVTGGRLNVYNALPGFSLGAAPTTASVPRDGGTVTYAVTIARRGGFAEPITLAVGGLPPDGTASFSANPANGASATLTVTTTPATPRGSYQLTITGTGGPLTRTTSVTLKKGNGK